MNEHYMRSTYATRTHEREWPEEMQVICPPFSSCFNLICLKFGSIERMSYDKAFFSLSHERWKHHRAVHARSVHQHVSLLKIAKLDSEKVSLISSLSSEQLRSELKRNKIEDN